ncbi:benzoate 4-monooxygenase cytochrome p450 [Exophiala viscosa]|uniref:Benzoate 4-monooxygenase cytochrome p450 n=1 Tax=Exophiala viscosa TaxID=2486360 RepID=A0AAN6IDF4_9EURO|nr:benzoate 4-monooxygenase cytochrome p450 [Exophiala viscosa]KAI1622622.1 benzoate 4-monooxygenase cytochrome p450 [Exophiala viscosa]
MTLTSLPNWVWVSYSAVVLSVHRSALSLLVAVAILSCLSFLAYRLFLSPLSKVPGPWYTNISHLFMVYHDFNGTKRLWIHNLHLRYGCVVRLAPNEVSFASAAALKEIYTSAGGYAKTELYSLFKQNDHRNLFTALDKKEHNEKKKRLADRYTNTAVLHPSIQEPLRERGEAFAKVCGESESTDIYLYLHCYALDCVSAMIFHPYGTKSVEGGSDHDMVRNLSYHDSRSALVLRHHYPWLEAAYKSLTPKRPSKGGKFLFHYAWSSMRASPHSDFTLATRLLQHPEMGMEDMVAECLDHIGAGIDTTGDALCFLMWELSQSHNAERMQRLIEELQTCDPEHGGRLNQQPYLNAVIEETMRLWAPGTLPLPRYVPQGGRVIDGYYIPAHTIVSAQSYTVHRLDQSVFPEPDKFLPERWLEEKGSVDRQRLMFAFGSGARSCIGKFLALSEMRILLHSVYSRYRTRPAADMHASMEMSDQLLTSRPKDLLCKLTFDRLIRK